MPALISPRPPVFRSHPSQLWVAPKALFSAFIFLASLLVISFTPTASAPASSPVSGALTSLLSLASAFLMKHLHPGEVNSFPSPGKQPPLDHTAQPPTPEGLINSPKPQICSPDPPPATLSLTQSASLLCRASHTLQPPPQVTLTASHPVPRPWLLTHTLPPPVPPSQTFSAVTF